MRRLAFVVDGFNLYHSIVDLEKATGRNYRWLDIRSLCESFLSAIGGGAEARSLHYFSALAHHREKRVPGTVARHQAFISALESTDVTVELAKFKRKSVNYKCGKCGFKGSQIGYEEKETDVAMATKIIELALEGALDGLVIVSGDSDLVPAVRAALRLQKENKLPGWSVYFLFPFGRHSADLKSLASATFSLGERHYAAHQFSDTLSNADGAEIIKPQEWV